MRAGCAAAAAWALYGGAAAGPAPELYVRIEVASPAALDVHGRLQYAPGDSVDLVLPACRGAELRFEAMVGTERLVLHPDAAAAYRAPVPRGAPLQWDYRIDTSAWPDSLAAATGDARCVYLRHALAEPRFAVPVESTTAVLGARLMSGAPILAAWPEKERVFRPAGMPALLDAFVGLGAWRLYATASGRRVAVAGEPGATDSLWVQAIAAAAAQDSMPPDLVFLVPGEGARVWRGRSSWLVRWPAGAPPPAAALRQRSHPLH